MRDFISYKESLKIIDDIPINQNSTQKLYIMDSINHILSQNIIAKENSPAFETSGMDGYAIKYEDQKLNILKIIDKNPAGSVVESVVSSGNCIKTFTGSLMPEGSDTLIPIENVEVVGDDIKIISSVPKGFAVREVGENYKDGEVLIKKGTKIGFSEIGILASLNIVQVEVFINPTVAIISSGSEILELGETQTNDAQIRSSNNLTIEALARKNGANVIQLGVVKDDIDSITNAFKTALKKADILVTTGGVSVGDYDFVQDVVKDKLGAKVLFHGVKIKPGMHLLLAQVDDKFILSLPGFAYSSTVCAILYLLKFIYKFRNSSEKLQIVQAKMKENFPRRISKTTFTACNVEYINGEYLVDFENKKSGTSAILTNMLGESALLIQDENSSDLKIGDNANIILLNNY